MVAADENENEIQPDDNVEDPEESVDESIDSVLVNEGTHSPQPETFWEEAMNDATELENMLFSMQRPTVRHRLEKLVGALKILGSKLKCHEEVKTALYE